MLVGSARTLIFMRFTAFHWRSAFIFHAPIKSVYASDIESSVKQMQCCDIRQGFMEYAGNMSFTNLKDSLYKNGYTGNHSGNH